MKFKLNTKEQRYCLDIARNSIQHKLDKQNLPALSESYPNLTNIQGVFVTLTINKHLRGCIGNIIGQYPLQLGIQKMAIQAAFNDPRFAPLSLEDNNNIHIEISVLSPLFNINYDDIVIGEHGVLLTYQFSSAVFLPQVPVDQNWSKTEYLQNLCQKAGVTKDTYLKDSCKLQGFTAFVFGDTK